MVFLRSRELSVRTAEKGGAVASQVELGPGETLIGKRRIVLLIHGYCNDLDDARQSYSIFRQHLSASKAGNSLHKLPMADLFSFFWPGDKDWGPPRFMSYFLEIGPAQDSAKALAKFLRDLPQVFDLYLIAHSLGNRLVLELLKDLRLNGMPRIRLKGICMMAAAVPVSDVRWQGPLHDASLLAYSQVLYSPGDWVLRFGFRVGETAALDGLLPEAVGLHGKPEPQWNGRQEMWGRRRGFFGLLSAKDRRYGHSDYWSLEETAEPVAEFFDTSRSRRFPRHTIAAHIVAPPNELTEATIARHRVPIA